MLEEGRQAGKLAHRARELLQVLEPALRLRGVLRLPHRDEAALLEHELGEFLGRKLFDRRRPAIEIGEETCARPDAASASARRSRSVRAPRASAKRRRAARARAARRASIRQGPGAAGCRCARRRDRRRAGTRRENRRARRGFRRARRSAGRRSRDKAAPISRKRSSNSRIWNEARTRIGDVGERNALALRRLDLVADRARLFRAVPDAATTGFSPISASVNSVLPSRLRLCAMSPEATARMWPVER